jgi:hypothetical protein
VVTFLAAALFALTFPVLIPLVLLASVIAVHVAVSRGPFYAHHAVIAGERTGTSGDGDSGFIEQSYRLPPDQENADS